MQRNEKKTFMEDARKIRAQIDVTVGIDCLKHFTLPFTYRCLIPLPVYVAAIVISSLALIDISWNFVTLCYGYRVKDPSERNVNRRDMIIMLVLRHALHSALWYNIIISYYRDGISRFVTAEWKSNLRQLTSSCVFWEFETLSSVG